MRHHHKLIGLLLIMMSLSGSVWSAVPPPPGCGFDDAVWQAIGLVEESHSTGAAQKFTCASETPMTVQIKWIKLIKGNHVPFFDKPWTYSYIGYHYFKKGCTGPTSVDFKKGRYYRISFHRDPHTKEPWYCNEYLVELLGIDEYPEK